MKVLIFSPYMDSLGGGERYTAQIIKFFLQHNYEVDLAWNDNSINNKLKLRFNIDIGKTRIFPDLYRLFSSRKNLLLKFKLTRKYNIIFYVSDGSIPFLFGKKNLLHFQVPFKNIAAKNWFNQLKLSYIYKIVCNSNFTKKIIDTELGTDSSVLYPPLNEGFSPSSKENIILSVGRFDNIINSKKQDFMIRVFKQLINQKKLASWKLILTGGSLYGSEFISRLKKDASGYPIEIKQNVSYKDIKRLYSKSKIYWHAAGFGEDLSKHPEKAEHFGIAPLEAMASGCAVIVYSGGGLPEIIEDKKNGYLFKSAEQLKETTLDLAANPSKRVQISRRAIKRAADFAIEKFNAKLNEIIR